jgi:hypothetical protein
MRDDRYQHDGINYDITLVEQNNMFRATWTCTACDKSGGLRNGFPQRKHWAAPKPVPSRSTTFRSTR